MSLLSAQQDIIDDYIDDSTEDSVRDYLLQGKTRDQLERHMRKMFLYADESCTGDLSTGEFKSAMAQMGLPLNASQITNLMRMVDVNRDGKVSYEEFVPVAFEVICKVLSGTVQPPKPARAAAPAPAPAPVAKPTGWSAYNNLYSSKTASEAPMRKVEVQGNDEVASLEGRVLAVQSRRIIRSKIKDLFARLDSDKDGRLTAQELSAAFGSQIAQRIQKSMDANHDGRVTQFEMRRFFDDSCQAAVQSGVAEYKYLEGIVEMLESISF